MELPICVSRALETLTALGQLAATKKRGRWRGIPCLSSATEAKSRAKSFLQVQSILDQNRLLINEINQKHNSKTPDDLSRNVGLIRELNDNIRRAVDLYGDLSVSFADSMDAELYKEP